MNPRSSQPVMRMDDAARPASDAPAELVLEPDDLELTDATTDEVIAWHEGRGPCPWPR
ncbi:MAG: hypothetical protein WCJ30_25820 [Deltaproteobacteria bacterium]